VLSALVESYERETFPIDLPNPVAVLDYAFTDMGHSQAELAELLGSRSRASEIMNRKRPMTLDQIRTISEVWNLPIELLTRPYATTA
jgi:HTH-type transcriptional regulator/antitoxin HigA